MCLDASVEEIKANDVNNERIVELERQVAELKATCEKMSEYKFENRRLLQKLKRYESRFPEPDGGFNLMTMYEDELFPDGQWQTAVKLLPIRFLMLCVKKNIIIRRAGNKFAIFSGDRWEDNLAQKTFIDRVVARMKKLFRQNGHHIVNKMRKYIPDSYTISKYCGFTGAETEILSNDGKIETLQHKIDSAKAQAFMCGLDMSTKIARFEAKIIELTETNGTEVVIQESVDRQDDEQNDAFLTFLSECIRLWLDNRTWNRTYVKRSMKGVPIPKGKLLKGARAGGDFDMRGRGGCLREYVFYTFQKQVGVYGKKLLL